MAKNDEIVIPSSPADLKKLNSAVKEIANSFVRMEGERDQVKEIIDEVHDITGIPKKHIRNMARDYHKHNFNQKVEEMSDYQQLYESVMETNFGDDGEEDQKKIKKKVYTDVNLWYNESIK